MLFLYSLILSLILLLGAPILLPWALLWPKARQGFLQRLGFLPRELRQLMYVGEESLWVHVASLGELNAIAPALRLLLPKIGKRPFLITATSMAGLEQAKRFFPEAVAHFLLPLDLPIFLKPLIRRYKPKFAILSETELWPNFLDLLKEARCETMLMNGRLSERSLRRYSLWRSLFARTLLNLDVLAVQSEEDAARFLALGAKVSRVNITGNCKFDILEEAKVERRRAEALAQEMGLDSKRPLLVAGSSRPGEEELFLESFRGLKRKIPALRLLLAPRHMERMGKVERLIKQKGFDLGRRSAGATTAEVILLDSLGELSALYSLASLAWIGGSFRPYGGQNPLEASAQGVPVLFGPDMRHFREVARILLESNAAFQVSAEDLESRSLEIFENLGLRQKMSEAALQALKLHAGASQRSAELAWKLAVLVRTREEDRDWRNQSAFASLKVSEFGKGFSAEP